MELPGRDEAFKAMIGLAGGTGHLTKGTCGALAGAVAAISLSYNLEREEVRRLVNDSGALHPDDPKIPIVFQNIYDISAEVARKMEKKYGGILCSEIQFNLYGKTLDISDPKRHWELCDSFPSYPLNCWTVEGDLAQWTVEILLKGKG